MLDPFETGESPPLVHCSSDTFQTPAIELGDASAATCAPGPRGSGGASGPFAFPPALAFATTNRRCARVRRGSDASMVAA